MCLSPVAAVTADFIDGDGKVGSGGREVAYGRG